MPRRLKARPRPQDLGIWLTSDLGRLFGVHPQSVATWLDSGKWPMPFVRTPGGKRVVRQADLIAFLKGDEQYKHLLPEAMGQRAFARENSSR